MKVWKLVSGLFTILLSLYATFSGMVFSIDNAINDRADKGDSYVLLINLFLFLAGVVSIFVRKSRIAGNIAIIVLFGITALIGFSSGGGSHSQWYIVAGWSVLCAAFAALSLLLNVRKGSGAAKPANGQFAVAVGKCPYCGADTPTGSLYCGACGKELPREFSCPRCGNVVAQGAHFCSKCGMNLSEGNQERNSEHVPVYSGGDEEESVLKKYVPYVVGAVVLAALCGGMWWYYISPKSQQTVNDTIVTDSIAAVDSVAEAVEEVVDTMNLIPADTVLSDTEPKDETYYPSDDEAVADTVAVAE